MTHQLRNGISAQATCGQNIGFDIQLLWKSSNCRLCDTMPFFKGILAGLSTIQGLNKLTFRFSERKYEQCLALVEVPRHGCLKTIKILQHRLKDPDKLLRSLMGCTSMNREGLGH